MARDLIVQPARAVTRSSGERLHRAFLEGLSSQTLRAYSQDLEKFAAYLGHASSPAALDELLQLSPGQGNGVLLSYRAQMKNKGLTPATINRRLSSVRSAVKLGRTLGLTNWVPAIDGVKVQSFRDTRGPGLSGTRALLNQALSQRAVKAARDAAMVRLFFDLGLRRNELVGLDVEHVASDDRIWIQGKGRSQREAITLPAATKAAVCCWLAARSTVAGPDEAALFVNLTRDTTRCGKRITPDGVYKIVKGLGAAVGIATRPHGLRHASITAALDAGSDPRSVQKHARHVSLETTMRYDDNRQDLAGVVARQLADVLSAR